MPTIKCPNCMIELHKDGERLECMSCGFNTYPNQKILDKLYAIVSVEPQTQCEGIIGLAGPMGVQPAVTSDYNLAKKMEADARRATRSMGMKAKIIEFTRTKVMREI